LSRPKQRRRSSYTTSSITSGGLNGVEDRDMGRHADCHARIVEIAERTH
jgi:hypothetical protein